VRAALGAKFQESAINFIQLGFFALQSLVSLFNQRVRLLNFFALLRAFGFGSSDIASETLNQLVQLLGSLPIELDLVSVRVNFAIKMLEFAATARNLCVDLFQRAALLGKLAFACVDFGASGIF
jgi:hypothetical protein